MTQPSTQASGRAFVVPTVVVLALVAIVVGSALLDAGATDATRAELGLGHGLWSALVGAFVGVCGAVILAHDPRQVVGWVVTGCGLFWAFDGLCEAYAVRGLGADRLPGAGLALWVVTELGAFLLVALPAVLVLYPTGRLPVGRWRTVAQVVLVASLALPLALVLAPDLVAHGDDLSASALEALPALAVPLGDGVARVVLTVAQLVTLLALPLAAAVHFSRHARAEGVERTQLRWVLWAALVCLLAGALTLVDLTGPLGFGALIVALAVTSVSVVIGIVRPHTGDVDALVGSTVVYGGIAVAVIALDLVVLALVNAFLGDRLAERQVTVIVLLLAVAAYGPLRGWLTALVRRRLVGRRGDRYEVVSTLAADLEQSETIEEQLPSLARAIAGAFGIGFVRVQVLGAAGEGRAATHGSAPTTTRAVPIVYRGDRIGTVTLPDVGLRSILSRRDEALLVDVVRQAAIAVRGSLLARELQESRERLVLSREEDRRRIRRDLHDGLGPVLGGVAMRLDAAGNAVESDPASARRLVAQSREDITEALSDVRRLVHGLRPPALDDLGLRAAVDQQVDRVATDRLVVHVDADDLPHLPAAVEVAAYRIISEALTNVSRHAGATQCRVTLRVADGALAVEVADDGRGIDADVVAGVGLRSIRERVEELGGRSLVECPATGGTCVQAWLTIPKEAQ